MAVGILGGTFDPIHLGHLLVAEEARQALGLERVVFLPAGQPWLKAHRPLTPSQHRLRMVELAVEGNPCFQVSRHEVDRPGPTFTVDTLEELGRELGEDTALHFIVGQDALQEFHRWKDPEGVLEQCRLVVVPRPAVGAGLGLPLVGGAQQAAPLLDWPAFFARYPQAAGRVVLLPVPLVEISGTQVRQRVAAGLSIRYQVPDAVAEYIREHRLYREGD